MLEWGYERQFAGYSAVCGIDEAGRGPLAGPVVAAAVILPEGCVKEAGSAVWRDLRAGGGVRDCGGRARAD